MYRGAYSLAVNKNDDQNLINCTFSGNVATVGNGGSIFSNQAFNMYNLTISDSKAENGYGGGVYVTNLKDTVISLS